MKTTIQKIASDWIAGYIGKDGINHYVTHEKTKDKLIHKLIDLVVKQSNTKKR
jgi:hypothetical protein